MLREWTDELVDSVKDGENLVDCYATLEDYFGELLSIQAKGLVLTCNALKQQNNKRGRFVGSKEDFRDRSFWPNISEQMRVFCACVDRLAAAQTSPKNEGFITKVGDVQEMYSRVDWLAALVSENFSEYCEYHWDYGLHVHIFQDRYKVHQPGVTVEHPVNVQYRDGTQWQDLGSAAGWSEMSQSGFTSRFLDTQEYVDGSGYVGSAGGEPFYCNYVTTSNQVLVDAKLKADAAAQTFKLRAVGHQHYVDPLDRPEYEVTTATYDRDFNRVSAGSDGAHVHGTLVIDYRRRDTWWKWQEKEVSENRSGWVLTPTNAGSDRTTEFWAKLQIDRLSSGQKTSNASFNYYLQTVTQLQVTGGANKRKLKWQWEDKYERSGLGHTEYTFYILRGFSQLMNQATWKTYTYQKDLQNTDKYFPELRLKTNVDGDTMWSNNAKGGWVKGSFRNFRAYLP